MRNYILNTIAIIAIVALGFVVSSSAQTVNRAVVDIPFDFFVGNQKMPQGRYEFERANKESVSGLLKVRSLTGDKSRSMLVMAAARDAGEVGMGAWIRFNRYGSVHCLAGVYLDPGKATFHFRKANVEKQLAKEYRDSVPVSLRPRTTTGG